MKTSYNNHEYAKKVALLLTQAAHVNPPAIAFRRKKPKDDEEDEKLTKIKICLDPDDEDSDEFESRCFLFESGDAEKWVKWRIQFDELVRDVPLNDGDKKTKYAKALMTGEARERFANIVADLRQDDAMEEETDAEAIFNEAVEKMGRFYFGSQHAYRRQKSYLRYAVFMMEMPLDDFRAELSRQNNMLRYFPIPNDRIQCDTFDDDELVEIVDRAKRVEWQRDLLTANIDPYSMTLDEYYEYLEKLEAKYEMDFQLRHGKKEKEKRNVDQPKKAKATKKSANAAKIAPKTKTSAKMLLSTAVSSILPRTTNAGAFLPISRIAPTSVHAVTKKTCSLHCRWKRWSRL